MKISLIAALILFSIPVHASALTCATGEGTCRAACGASEVEYSAKNSTCDVTNSAVPGVPLCCVPAGTILPTETTGTSNAVCSSGAGTACKDSSGKDGVCSASGLCEVTTGGTIVTPPATQTTATTPSSPASTGGSGFVALAPIPGLTQGVTADTAGLANFFNNLYKYLIGIAAILAIIMIIWDGLRIATNQDNVSILTDSKGRIYNAIFGLILVLSPVLVFSIINPSILNLSIGLKKLDTTTSSVSGSTGSNSSGAITPTTTASGCSVIGVAGILQIASCPSVDSATAWGQTCTGNLTSTTDVNSTTGVITRKVLCAGKQPYVFIYNSDTTFTLTINRLQPLVSTADRSRNADDAINFRNICSSAGFKTCVSDRPIVSFSVPCNLTQERSWKCYRETLSCEKSVVASASDICSENPSWAPFQ